MSMFKAGTTILNSHYMIKILPLLLLTASALLIFSCQNLSRAKWDLISTDSTSISNGSVLFEKDCKSCHSFRSGGIGPSLGEVTKVVSPKWIMDFIKGPNALIQAKDKRADSLFVRFKTIMPSFPNFSEEQMDDILSFMYSQRVSTNQRIDTGFLSNPIPESIPLSDLIIEMELFAQIPASSEKKPLTRITKLVAKPNSDQLFVLDLRGKLYFLDGNTPSVYFDIVQVKPKFIHQPGLATGFGSFAFHPDFAQNGLLYTSHTEGPGSAKSDFGYNDSIPVVLQWVLSEWKTRKPEGTTFVGEPRELFRIDMVSPIHGMQEIAFNSTSKIGDADFGLLYVGIGDGGCAENGFSFLCHNLETLWGTVIRIDPQEDKTTHRKYSIPKGNPLAKSTDIKIRKEIFAYGFRNPHRITWAQSGMMLVSNIGQRQVESIYSIHPGSDSGWPHREGTFAIDPIGGLDEVYPLPSNDSLNHFNYPVAQYDHNEGNAIAGGFEYSGKRIPALGGKFIFMDIVKGRLFYVMMNDLKIGSQAPIQELRFSLDGKIKSLKEITGTDKVDGRFGIDNQGELYLTTKPDGKIYRLMKSWKK